MIQAVRCNKCNQLMKYVQPSITGSSTGTAWTLSNDWVCDICKQVITIMEKYP